MAENLNLYEDESGQRYAWNGLDFVPVSKDFDPRESSVFSGARASLESIGAGLSQVLAAIEGDDAALAELSSDAETRGNEMSVLAAENPLGTLTGQLAPYAAGAAAGGALAGAAGGSAALGATAADVGIGLLEYGTPQERLLRGAMAGLPYAGLSAIRAVRQARRGGSAAQRTQAAIAEGAPSGVAGVPLEQGLPRGASGSYAFEATPGQVNSAEIANMRISRMAGMADPEYMTRKRQFINWADELGIPLTRAERFGGRAARMVQDTLESSPVTAGLAHRHAQGFLGAIRDNLNKVMFPDAPAPRGDVGTPAWRAAAFDSVTDDYGKWRELAPPAVNPGDVQQAYLRMNEGRRVGGRDYEPVAGRWTETAKQLSTDLMERWGEQYPDGSRMTGEQMITELRRMRREAFERTKRGGGEIELAEIYTRAADAIEIALEDAPNSALTREVINRTNKRYQLLTALERANAFKHDEGISFRKLYNVFNQIYRDQFGRMRGFSEEGFSQVELEAWNDLFKATHVAEELGDSIVGNSGTATRLSIQDFEPSALGSQVPRYLMGRFWYQPTEPPG